MELGPCQEPTPVWVEHHEGELELVVPRGLRDRDQADEHGGEVHPTIRSRAQR